MLLQTTYTPRKNHLCQHPIGPPPHWLAEEQRISHQVSRKLCHKTTSQHRIAHSTNAKSTALPWFAEHQNTVYLPTRTQPKSALTPSPLQVWTIVAQQLGRRNSLPAPTHSKMEAPPIIGPSPCTLNNRIFIQRSCDAWPLYLPPAGDNASQEQMGSPDWATDKTLQNWSHHCGLSMEESGSQLAAANLPLGQVNSFFWPPNLRALPGKLWMVHEQHLTPVHVFWDHQYLPISWCRSFNHGFGNKTRLLASTTPIGWTDHMPGVAVFFGTQMQPG